MKHHYQGPGKAHPSKTGWRYRVHIEPGSPRPTRKRIVSVLHDPRSFIRCGVRVRLAASREEADCIVAIRNGGEPSLNVAGFDCGHAEAGLSCCHTVGGVGHITFVYKHLFGNPDPPARAVNHEFCHAIFRACDMFEDPEYTGIMGHGERGTAWPTDDDAADCSLWLEGRAPEIGC